LGGIATSAASTTTRITPDVPMLSAIRPGATQPLPTLLQAPSPTAGNHRAPASAGQRRTHASRSGGSASSRSISVGSRAGSMPSCPSRV
jgi:hypothetical protein